MKLELSSTGVPDAEKNLDVKEIKEKDTPDKKKQISGIKGSPLKGLDVNTVKSKIAKAMTRPMTSTKPRISDINSVKPPSGLIKKMMTTKSIKSIVD
jgi:hypothetical protein